MVFNEFQIIKRKFFSYRNGVTADALRKSGSPFRIIFGLNLPQIASISRGAKPSVTLAESFWENNSTRCSMLLAPMLMPPEEFTPEMAQRWCSEVPNEEIADNLCHSLLRKLTFRDDLMDNLLSREGLEQYIGLRLLLYKVRETGVGNWNTVSDVLTVKPEDNAAVRFLKHQITAEINDAQEY